MEVVGAAPGIRNEVDGLGLTVGVWLEILCNHGVHVSFDVRLPCVLRCDGINNGWGGRSSRVRPCGPLGGAGYASLMHTATDFVCRLYVASEELRVRLRPRHRIARVNIPRVLLTLGGIMSALMSALMSASLTSILVFCFFQSGGASSSDSSLSQSSNIVRDTFEHAPESTDAAEAAESGGESSGADAAGGVCECAIAGGSCDNCCGAVIYWGSRGGGHGCKYL
jgi:hypothetical protein